MFAFRTWPRRSKTGGATGSPPGRGSGPQMQKTARLRRFLSGRPNTGKLYDSVGKHPFVKDKTILFVCRILKWLQNYLN
jgi:hypothetical protein